MHIKQARSDDNVAKDANCPRFGFSFIIFAHICAIIIINSRASTASESSSSSTLNPISSASLAFTYNAAGGKFSSLSSRASSSPTSFSPSSGVVLITLFSYAWHLYPLPIHSFQCFTGRRTRTMNTKGALIDGEQVLMNDGNTHTRTGGVLF